MRLWIANTTKQYHEFVYRPRIGDGGKTDDGIRRPVFGEARKQLIPLGGQICLGDLKEGEIRNILDQHKHIVEFNKLTRVRGFQGLCYREGDPIPIEDILERIETNDTVRTEESEVRQTNTAAQIAANMRTVAQRDDTPFQDLRETNVQIAQVGADGVNGGTPEMNRVIEVPEEGKAPSGRGRKSAS